MSGDRYLRDFNENLERLRGVFEEYDSANQSLGRLNAITDDIEDVFENIITENEDLSRRLGYRKEQGKTYQEIIEDMSDKLSELEKRDEEEFEIDYLLDEIESLFNENLPDVDKQTQTGFSGLYKSPIINLGKSSHRITQDSESDQNRYKSPKINVGPAFATQPTNSGVDTSRVPGSWDDYSLGGDLSDFEFSGEPEFDSPETYLESRDTGLREVQTEGSVSVNVSYDGASHDDLAFLNAAS
jgi:hypothetical protein